MWSVECGVWSVEFKASQSSRLCREKDQIVFPATCASEKLLWAQLMQAPRADQAGPKPRAIKASNQKARCSRSALFDFT